MTSILLKYFLWVWWALPKTEIHSNICLLCYQYYELHRLAPPFLKGLFILRFM